MKRKRRSEQIDDPQSCDLILTDASGRSVRVHKALLMDKSDYFAQILTENNLYELQLDENYLIDLIHYLYRNEADGISFLDTEDSNNIVESNINNGDIEILMQLLALSKKYSFRYLYRDLMIEINCKIRPSSVLTIYKCAVDLGIVEIQNSTRLMILTWLPQLQQTDVFYSLSEKSIHDIFAAEAPDVDNEVKLNALSKWWSHNQTIDMTNLWVQLSLARGQQ